MLFSSFINAFLYFFINMKTSIFLFFTYFEPYIIYTILIMSGVNSMENTNMTLVAAVLIVGLVVGAGVGYYMAPSGDGGDGETQTITVEVNPLDGKTIQIGNIQASTAGMEQAVPQYEDLTAPHINEYLDKLGYDTSVEFLMDTADGQAAIHLEKVQSFKSMDITIFQGGGWSSQAQAALGYVNDNDMLMISSSSTSPLLAISNDRLFRTCPTDLVQAPAISNMWESWGADAILIFQRGDSWADGIYNVLIPELEKKGIVVIERVRYAAEVTEFSSYLATMDDLLGEAIEEYGAERVGVQTMMFAEGVVIDTQTVDYPNTRAVIWMGTEDHGRNQRYIDDAAGTHTELRHFSSLMTPAKSWKWEKLDTEYTALTSQRASFYTATGYDAAWCIALSVIDAGSLDANDVAPLWPDIGRTFFGASGWVDLDDNGDRKPGIFDIWGFSDIYPEGFTTWGQYNGIELSVNWDDAKLAEHGIVRPGPG
jgi:branched-chain amino acid transport system substrate-binding protein